MNTRKLLSLVISLVMVIGMIPFYAVSVSADAPVDAYYVCYGGTGDGRSVENPAADVAAAIASINADGWTTGDDVTVYIMQVADAVTYGVGAEKLTESHFTYFQQNGGTLPAYTATLTITSYDYANTGMKYLAYTHLFGQDIRIQMNGPTILKDIGIVHGRQDYREVDCNGYDVTFDNAPMFKTGMDQHGSATYGGALSGAAPNVAMGKSYESNNGAGGTVTVKTALNSSGGKRGIFIPCIVGTQTQTFTDDAALILDHASLSTYVYFGSEAVQTATYQKNLSIVVENAAKVTFATVANASTTVNVGGALQIIDNAKTITGDVPSCVKVTGGTWFLVNNDKSLGTLALTSTPGTFAYTTSESYAVAVGEHGLVVGEGGTLTLDPGKYTVTFTDELPNSTYYVKLGAEGDGRSEDAPAGSMTAVINAINADGWGKGNNVTVVVIDRDDVLDEIAITAARGTPHKMLSWGNTPTFAATITITSPEGTTSHLATSAAIGGTDIPVIAGDVIFDNIYLAMVRLYDASFAGAGHNITFTENVKVGRTGNDYGDGPDKSPAPFKVGSLSNYAYIFNILRSGASGATAEGGDIRLAINNGQGLDLRVGYRENKTYANDFNIYVENAPSVSVSATHPSGYTATFGKNLNFRLGSSVRSFAVNGTGTNLHSSAVNGSVQVIGSNALSVNDIAANLNITGDVYVLKTADADCIDFTETAGTFTVTTEKPVVQAVSDEGYYYTTNGILTLPCGGDYTVNFLDAMPDPCYEYYVQYGANGDGKSAASPAGSIAAIIDKINADTILASDEVIINVIDASDALTYCPNVPGRDTTAHHILAWSANASWRPTLVIRSLEGTTAHLANSPLFGGTAQAMMMGKARFENIMLVMTRGSDASFESGGNAVEITDTVTFGQMPEFAAAGVWNGKFSDYNFIFKLGGNTASGNAPGAPVIFDISNGKRLDLRVGWRDAATYTNDVTAIVDGVSGLTFNCGDINQATYNKNLNIKLLSGADFTIGGYDSSKCKLVKINGAFQLIMPAEAVVNGVITNNLAVSNVYVVKASDPAAVDFTAAAGTFANNSGKTAFFVSTDGLSVEAVSGTEFTAAAGENTVYFAEDINSLTYVPAAPEGMIFNGWEADGTTYTAKFVTFSEYLNITETDYDEVTDLNRSTSFYVEGVQVRLFDQGSGSADQGLRFVATIGKDVLDRFAALSTDNKKPSTSSDTGIGYGFLVTPAAKVTGELTFDTAKKTIVPAVNTYKEINESANNDSLQFTVCILGIDAAHWTNEITARPYITYKDSYGNVHTAYGEEYTTSVYDAVDFGIKNDPANADALSALMQAYETEIAGK